MANKKQLKGIYENTIYNRQTTSSEYISDAITYKTAFPDLTSEYYENEQYDDWYFISKNQIMELSERDYSDDFLGTNNAWTNRKQAKKEGWFR